MNLYKCKFLDKNGDIKTNKLFAKDEESLSKIIGKNENILIRYKKQRSSIKKPLEDFTIPFLKNLHQLIGNKLDLMLSLDITSKLFQTNEQRLIVESLIEKIKSGSQFSESISKFDRYFNELTVKIIGVSEKTARLNESLINIISYLESESSTKRKIKNSTRYPIILLFCIIFVMLFWFLFIVPKFAELFNDIGTELPFLTKYIIKFSTLCSNNTFLIFGIVTTIFACTAKVLSNKNILEKIANKIPIIKKIKREINTMNFFSAMTIMLKEKINLIDALECLGNFRNSIEIKNICYSIKNGNSLSNSMKKCQMFTEYEISIIESGEKSGDLWPAFKSASDMLKIRLNERSEKIVNMIQPIAIIFAGGLLLLIVCSVIIPMYSNLDINF